MGGAHSRVPASANPVVPADASRLARASETRWVVVSGDLHQRLGRGVHQEKGVPILTVRWESVRAVRREECLEKVPGLRERWEISGGLLTMKGR
jgi:hypothetical protein